VREILRNVFDVLFVSPSLFAAHAAASSLRFAIREVDVNIN
jgi:hypothetical protein